MDLGQFTIQCGENNLVPYIIFNYKDFSYNIFGFLNSQNISFIHTLRDFAGTAILLITTSNMIRNLPKLLDGNFYGVAAPTQEEYFGLNVDWNDFDDVEHVGGFW